MKEYRYEGARCQNALSSWVDLIPPSKASSKCNPISNSGNQFSSGISLQTICAVDKVVAVRLYEDSLIKADIKRFNKLTKPASNQIPTKGYLIQLNVGVVTKSVHPGGGMAQCNGFSASWENSFCAARDPEKDIGLKYHGL